MASLCLFFSIISLLAFVPRDEDPLGKLVANLQKWTDTIPQEKIYLHTDKPYYALGDTIWFKGYLTIGSRHQLSALSGAVYVDLINQNDSLMQQLKLPVTAGMVMGNFILKDDYLQGNYRLRAYTQWMRNAGEEYFYDHTFLIGDVAGGNFTARADFRYKTDKDKPQLQAILNYTNNAGNALANQSLRYEIKRKNKAIWQQNTQTDASGNLAIDIPSDVTKNPAGTYIRTYINIKEGKNTVVREFPIKAGLSQSDVQFFPESGNLVNDLSSHIAFKAVGTDGLGINIKGSVTDNDNKEVAKIETLHAGMGSFILRPQTGKIYTANIKFDDGSTKTIALPQAAAQGYVLSVYQPNKDSLLVRIQASASLMQSSVNIIAHTGGEVILSAPLKIEKPLTSIWLNKKSFPTGIAQFTLFDNASEPLNERIAFIRTNDQMSLDIKTAKTTYGSKERVLAQLEAKDAKGQSTFGNFSVSVIDESKIPFDENKESTIFSNLLLTSDLKGYVEEPNYYFAKSGDDVDKALDNLMLTQGYRRFTWKTLNGTVTLKPKYAVEGLGSSLSGTVTTLGHKILPNAKVDLIALRAHVAKGTTTNARGRFSFGDLFITDSIKITIQARDQTKSGLSDKVILTLDSLPSTKPNINKNWPDVSTNIGGALKSYLTIAQKEDDLYEKMGLLDKVHRLREVEIKAKKVKVADADITPQGVFKLPDEQSADQLINVDPEEASHYITLGQYLQARLQGIQIGTGKYGSTLESLRGGSITLYIDGRRIDQPDAVSEALDGSYDPQDIAKIEVVRTNLAMINFLGGSGVLILTRLGTGRKPAYNPSVANITPKGFNKVREFYVPRYDRPGADLTKPDLRSTVFWSPYLKTDETGKTVFNFFTADGPGTYKVVIEGINADGQLGRKVYHFSVDGTKADANAPAPVSADKKLAMITAPIDSFNKRAPIEKVYLHTDKPYYNLGDTLWFKSYLLDGVNLNASRLSGILYIELDDDSTNVVRRISVPIKDGLGRGQIPLKPEIFKEGGYTLRAYTNWMQNFGGAYMFTQRFYLGIPSPKRWLAKSISKIKKVGGKDELDANIKLSYADDPTHAVAYQKVEVKLYDEWHYLSKEEMQTGADGSLNISHELGQKADGRRVRVQITSLNKDDHFMVTQVPLQVSRDQNIDLQFLPEGGNLVAGIKSVVGFKAVAESGLGIAVVGGIYDSKDKQVASFMPLHNGMGSFEFKPQAGETYTARISEPIAKAFPLPKIQPTGTVLHIENAENDSDLKIEIAGLKSLPADSAYYLVGISRGVVYYSQKIDSTNPALTVAKSRFPTGMTRFTFFEGRMPLNERAVFIENNDALNISVNPNKDNFLIRDSVGLDVMVKDKNGLPVKGSFSLSVTDDSQVKPDSLDNNGIAASLLLNAELRGTIESPGYYVHRKDKQAWRALDNLMLTQGWTGYNWKNLFTPVKSIKYKVEHPYEVKGTVTNVVNKPVPNTTVRLTSLRPPFTNEATTDEKGNFEFKNLMPLDSGAYILQALNNKGKVKSFGDVSVEKFKPEIKPQVPATLAMPWYVNTDTAQLNYLKRKAAISKDEFILTGRVLPEVKINSTKIIPESRSAFGPGGSDLVYDKKDIKASGATNLYDLLAQKLPGFRVIGYRTVSFRRQLLTMPILIFNGYSIDLRIDGRPVPLDIDPAGDGPELEANDITDVWAVDIEGPGRADVKYTPHTTEVIDALSNIKIEGLIGLEVAYSRRNTNRAGRKIQFQWAHVELTTQSGRGWYQNNVPNTTTYRPLPLTIPKQFYSPKYNTDSPVKELDYRSTIFWEPDVTTDMNGKAHLSFYTSDIKSKYTIKIAGTDGQGSIGDGVFKINNAVTNAPADSKKQAAEPAKKASIKVPAEASTKGIKLITDPLDSLNKRMPAEKVYLQTDKPYYNIGDTLWFKAYLVNGTDLTRSKTSGLLYVELDDDSTEMIRRVSVSIKDGLGWGQIPLSKKIFQQGGYTLRAYTNWMQNFNNDTFFSQRFYLGVPAYNAWLVNSNADISRIAGKDQLHVDLKITKPDKLLSPVALKKVQVKIYDEWHYLYKEEMQTGIDGSLKFSHTLNDKADGRRIRVQLTSLEKGDNYKVAQVPLVINRSQNIDLQFLPEGGKLVAGLKSTVGFKALAEDGRGMAVTGDVLNKAGEKVASISTLHSGMGSFEFTPEANETYAVKLTRPGGILKTFSLPSIAPVGTVMHIINTEHEDELRIFLSGINSLTTDSALYLIGTAKGKVYYSEKIESNTNEITIPKRSFPTGITRFTFFKGIQPLNERVVFIDNHDQLNIKITSNKASYNKRDSVSLTIEVKDKSEFPVQGNFSLAVIDNSQVRPDSLDNNGIAASLLLNSELNGPIENPGYYINRKDKLAWQALDNLLLTQGWTGYDWKDIFAPAKPIAFKVEKDFKITGRVVDLFNKPVTRAPVLMSSQKPSFVTTTITDENGVFTFQKLPTIDSGSFFIQSSNSKGKKLSFGGVSVEKFKAPLVPETIREPVLPWYVNTDSIQLNYVKRKIELAHEDDLKPTGRMLKEVNIHGKKIIPNSIFGDNASLTFDEQDIKESTVMNLYELLKQKLPGIKVIMKHNLPTLIFQGNYVNILFDTWIKSAPVTMGPSPTADELIDELSQFKIATFKSMQVFLSGPVNGKHHTAQEILDAEMRLLTHGSLGYLTERVLVPTNEPIGITTIGIITGNGSGWYKNIAPNSVTYRPLPILQPQQFYSPRYNSVTNSKPDYRPTLFWEPNVTTDANGRARISFYTSDITGPYTVKVAGMDDQGGLGDVIFKINDINKTSRADQHHATEKLAIKMADASKDSNPHPATNGPSHNE